MCLNVWNAETRYDLVLHSVLCSTMCLVYLKLSIGKHLKQTIDFFMS